ncbi:MAG: hypothetical protein AAF990_16655 [Bacteroidota bacterium]
MKAASVKELKTELSKYSAKQLTEFCLHLAKFKKENKELLTYLLYESGDEASYIRSVKSRMDEQFAGINKRSLYLIKKSVRKILKETKKYIRYSKQKETQVELLIHFCQQLKGISPTIFRSRILRGVFERQIKLVKKTLSTMHEDLQFDYEQELQVLYKD